MSKDNERYPPEEMLRIGILAAFVGGYLDAYTYVLHGGVFANTQTGNLIFMTIYLFQKEWFQVFLRVIPIFSFGLGIFLFEILNKFYKRNCTNLCLIIQIILVTIIGLGAFKENDIVVCSLISFICSLQLVSFKKIRGLPFATIMYTGNLRSFNEYLFKGILNKDKHEIKKSLKYLFVIFTFCLGVFLGMVFVNLIGYYSILLILINFITKFFLIYIGYKNTKEDVLII